MEANGSAPQTVAPGDAPYFAMLDAVTVPICLHRGAQILFANAAFEQLSGHGRGELRQMPFAAVVAPEWRESVRDEGDALMRGGQMQPPREIALLRAGGAETRPVEVALSRVPVNGRHTVMITCFDLSERKRAEAREQHFRRLLGQIMDGDPVPTFVIDARHRIVHWNRACAMITGIPASSVQGTNRQWSAFYPNERPVLADLIVDDAIENVVDTHYHGKFRRSSIVEGAYEAEDFFPQFGEKGCWLYFTAAPLRDAQGAIIGAIETLQDVTRRHEAEHALRQHQARLEQLVIERTAQLTQAKGQLIEAEKLASIGQLAAGVAHEINNPIGFVYSNVGALDKYVSNLFELLDAYEASETAIADPAAQSSLRALRRDVDLEFLREDIPVLMNESKDGLARVRKIVQDLRDFSHVDETQEWQYADLHKGLDATLNVAAAEIPAHADVVREYGALPEIECLPLQLNQVFMNLLRNAVQAMEGGRGTITIATGVAGERCWIEFRDSGCGMTPEVLARAFEPFFTTKPVGKGAGLGLSQAYGIVQQHNGTITASSQPGSGTTIRIELPLRHVEAPAKTGE